MTDTAVEPTRERRGRPGGGRDARIAARQAAAHAAGAPFLTRALKPFEVSAVVRTPQGFHLILVVDRKGERWADSPPRLPVLDRLPPP